MKTAKHVILSTDCNFPNPRQITKESIINAGSLELCKICIFSCLSVSTISLMLMRKDISLLSACVVYVVRINDIHS